jgi:putative DNA methylase
MTIRAALALINQELTDIVLGEIGDVDAETHFALTWFNGHFYDVAKYGEAEVLLKAKNANLNALRDSGVVRADQGVLQFVRPSELRAERLLTLTRADSVRRSPAWAQLIFLVAALTLEDGGTEAAADALQAIGPQSAERLKDLAYHCYLVCDRAKRSTEAQDFNALITAWPDLWKLTQERAAEPSEQRLL